jgi:hypothetical protein
LREHIRTGNVVTIGFITWTNNHFSAVCKVFLAELELGDSLHLPAAPDILPILRWAFNGLGHFAPPPEQVHIQPGHINCQRTLAGGGSCEVASCNFVETSVGLPIPRWRAIESAKFRDMFLQDILLYHLLACRQKNSMSCSFSVKTYQSLHGYRHTPTG